MITLLVCLVLFIYVFASILGFMIRAAWGLTKIFFGVLFLPVILLLMVAGGVAYLALPVLIVLGIISLVVSLSRA